MKQFRNRYRKNFMRDLITISLIILSPFLFFLYNIAPKDERVWKTKWLVLDALEFEDINYMLWCYSELFLTTTILCLWFITCKSWYRYAILVPILIEIYKVDGLISQAPLFFGLDIILQGIPFYVVFILILFLFSKKVGYYNSSKNISSELNKEVTELLTNLPKINREEYKILQKKLMDLRTKKESMDKKVYLGQLIALQDSIMSS
jgi:hypothetical protein